MSCDLLMLWHFPLGGRWLIRWSMPHCRWSKLREKHLKSYFTLHVITFVPTRAVCVVCTKMSLGITKQPWLYNTMIVCNGAFILTTCVIMYMSVMHDTKRFICYVSGTFDHLTDAVLYLWNITFDWVNRSVYAISILHPKKIKCIIYM